VRLLDLPQAKYFCARVALPSHGVEQSLPAFHTALGKVSRLQEGTAHFDIHRVNLLMSAERWLLFSIAHYRRAVEMLAPVSAPWAQVTLYYASFFSANAVMAMFGAWVGHTISGPRIVDVETGSPGQQELRIFRGTSARSPSGARGPHRIFWDFFYDAVPAVAAWAPTHLSGALTPVNGDYAWQISSRNDINYDMFHAWDASATFCRTFKSAKLKTLSGPLRQQFEATEQLIRVTRYFADEVALSAFALANCGFTGDRAHVQRRLVKQQVPSILNQSAFSEFLA